MKTSTHLAFSAVALAAAVAACGAHDEPIPAATSASEVVFGSHRPSRWLTLPHYLYSHAPRSGRLAVDLFNPGPTAATVSLRFEAGLARQAVLDPVTVTVEPGGRRQLLVGRPPEEQWDEHHDEDDLQFDIRGEASAPVVAFVAGGFDVGAGFGGVALENESDTPPESPPSDIAQGIPSIAVVSASYGLSCQAGIDNVKAKVEELCNGRPTCVLHVTTPTFGDPRPGCAKDFRVSWRCGDGGVQSRKLPPAFATGGHFVLDCTHLGEARSVPRPLATSTADVPAGHLFAQKIQLVAQKGVFPGCAGGFCPEAPLTRGDMAEIVVRAMFGNRDFEYAAEPYFNGDVSTGHPQYRFIQKFRELRITDGCAVGRFCPNDPVTRGQMAVFLTRALFGTDAVVYQPAAFFDDVPPGHLFFKHVQKFRELGITEGCRAREFCVNDATTRGQMAVFVARAFYADETN